VVFEYHGAGCGLRFDVFSISVSGPAFIVDVVTYEVENHLS